MYAISVLHGFPRFSALRQAGVSYRVIWHRPVLSTHTQRELPGGQQKEKQTRNTDRDAP